MILKLGFFFFMVVDVCFQALLFSICVQVFLVLICKESCTCLFWDSFISEHAYVDRI